VIRPRVFYLAAPFFNKDQATLVGILETMIESFGFGLISPRRSGLVLVAMKPEERARHVADIFRKNCEDMRTAHMMLAVIDDRDAGTMWEMGYMHCLGSRPIYTYTDKDYGVNVMLQGCVAGHARGPIELRDMLTWIKTGKRTMEFRPDAAKAY